MIERKLGARQRKRLEIRLRSTHQRPFALRVSHRRETSPWQPPLKHEENDPARRRNRG